MNSPTPPDGTSYPEIFLVEDDDGDAKAIRRALQRSNLPNPVRRAIDGVEALSILRDPDLPRPKSFLLLIDLNMPRMNGLELLREIRNDPTLHPAVAFVYSTSQDHLDKAAAYDLCVAGYILKGRIDSKADDLTSMLRSYCRVIEFPNIPV